MPANSAAYQREYMRRRRAAARERQAREAGALDAAPAPAPLTESPPAPTATRDTPWYLRPEWQDSSLVRGIELPAATRYAEELPAGAAVWAGAWGERPTLRVLLDRLLSQ